MMEYSWVNKKVLITGGTGFLGKHLVDGLLKAGAVLRILDFRKPTQGMPGAEFYAADIKDKDRVNELCTGIDTVFHLAALPSIARGKFSEYCQVNVGGTRNILEAAINNKIRKLVHVSSSTVYGVPQEFPLKETSPVRPIGKYGRSKLEAEELCREFIGRGLDASIIRPRVIIGPGRIGIFSILFDYIQNNKPVYIIGGGNNLFQFTNVFDMASACVRAAELPNPDLFNIGADNVLPVAEEMSHLIKYAKSRSRIVKIPASLAHLALKGLSFFKLAPLVDEQFMIADKNFKLDTAYARSKLGWHPEFSNVDSLIQAYDWYVLHIDQNLKQYKNIFGVLGRFKHSHMGGFQNG